MKRIQEEEKKPAKKLANLVRVGIIIFLVVFFVEIWAVNRLATFGDKIQELTSAQASLELENQVLQNSIAQKASLLSVSKQAGSYGFDNVKNFEYVKPINLASALSL